MDIEHVGEGNSVSIHSLPKGLQELTIQQNCMTNIINIFEGGKLAQKIHRIMETNHSPEEKCRRVLELPEIRDARDALDYDSKLNNNNLDNEDTKRQRFRWSAPDNKSNVIGEFFVLGICAMLVGNYQLAREFFVLVRVCSTVENVPLMHC